MSSSDVLVDRDGPVSIVTLNRPQYRNAQSFGLLDALDAAFDTACADPAVRVIVVRGSNGTFSSGHDLGTPDAVAERAALAIEPNTLADYNNFRYYNFDLLLKWRNLPKPIIAMVEGYCIFAGWMIVSATDIAFAASDAIFLSGFHEYFSVAWEMNPRKAKEILFESRFLTAEEAREAGVVNRVYPRADLERETLAFAHRVAENEPMWVRMLKHSINQAQDMQGYSVSVQAALSDFIVQQRYGGTQRAADGGARLAPVDLALRGLRGQRPGLAQGT